MALGRQQDTCLTVREIFEVERRLSAPLYQRQFAWTQENLNQFWEDIRLVEDGESEALFLGAIILKHESASDPSLGKLEEFLILDGQQRIATLFLTILAVALEWQEHGHQQKAISVAQNFLMSTRAATAGQPRFDPTIPDMPEFYALCKELKTKWKAPSAGKVDYGKMSDCLERSRQEVRSRSNTEDGFSVEDLRAFEQTLADKVEIAAINIAERHQPNEVFDRLNRTGQPLTVGDLVKNEIFRRLNAEMSEAIQLYNDHWQPYEDMFADEKQLEGYYHPFTLTVDDTATVANSFRALNRHWDDKIRDEDDAVTTAVLIIEDLAEFVPEYNSLSAGVEYPGPQDLQSRVARLARMPAPRVTYAFLMQLLRSHRFSRLSLTRTIECLDIVESFLVRRAFSGLEPTGLHAVFKGLWRKNEGNPGTLVSNLQTRTIEFPTDDQFRRDICERPFYGRRLARYVLGELEIASHRTNPMSRDQLEAITVDHLAPQSLAGIWRESFGTHTDEELAILLNLVGNLVPLSRSDNSTKGALSWSEASEKLRNETIYRTTREILEAYETWGPQEIAERSLKLAKEALVRWPRPVGVQ